MDIKGSMGLGSGGSIFSRKTELVADLTSAFKKLNAELERTKQLSADISKNIKGSFPGGGGGTSIFETVNRSTGTKDPSENDGTGGGNGGSFLKGLLSTLGKGAGLAYNAMPSVQQAFSQDTLRQQFGFYGGKNANATQMMMARNGTTTDPLDAARASMTGATMGLLPGMKNFNTVANSAATFSNLMPGIGLQGGMQATAALNQGQNVNNLRMIGINIRGSNGMMRDLPSIANDLWKTINQYKSGSQAISKEDLALSLQPGNALASMMDQYFGNDPLLRQGVIGILMQKAGGKGIANKSDMTGGEGPLTEHINQVSDRNAAALGATQAAAPFELKGMDEANKALETLNKRFTDLIGHSKALQKVLEGKGFVDTLATGGNGSMAGALGMAGAGALTFGKSIFGGIKNLFSGGMKGAGKQLFGKVRAGSALLGTATYAGLEKLQQFLNENNEDLPDFIKSAGNFAFDTGEGALTGLAVGKNPYAALAGMLAGGAGSLKNPYGRGGSDTGVEDSSMSLAYPLSNNPPITSPYGKTRFITFANGQKSPSYGQPHRGIDYGVSEGTPVYAIKDGVAQDTVYDQPGFGNYGKIVHEDGRVSYYGHLSSLLAKGGSRVKAGDLIGYSGNSGNSTGPHLHFEVRDGGQPIDPLAYLQGASDSKSGGSHPLHAGGLTALGGAGQLVAQPMGGAGLTASPEFSNKNGASQEYSMKTGDVSIVMNFPEGQYDPQAIKKAVSEVLTSDSIRKHAVSR